MPKAAELFVELFLVDLKQNTIKDVRLQYKYSLNIFNKKQGPLFSTSSLFLHLGHLESRIKNILSTEFKIRSLFRFFLVK